MWPVLRKQPIETVPQKAQMLDLADQNFKAVVINMFKEMKNKGKYTKMTQQIQNVNKIEIIKKPNSSSRVENYKDWNEKFTREIPQQTQDAPRNNRQLEDGEIKSIQSDVREKKSKTTAELRDRRTTSGV